MTECERMMDVDALIDGEAGEDAPAIERHVADCAHCRDYMASIQRNDALLRQVGATRMPDPELETRLFGVAEEDRQGAPRPSRRRLLGGLGAAAACAGGLGLLLRPQPSRAADFRDAVLGDFATNIAADHPLDIAASEPEEVMPWISARVPFVLPKRVTPEGTRLLGCRLCWLVGRRLAAFSIEMQQGRVGVYIAGAEGLSGLPQEGASPVMAGRDGLHGAFWRERGLALGIVGAVPEGNIADLARKLQG